MPDSNAQPMPDQSNNPELKIPDNLFSEADLKTIRDKAAAYKKAMQTASADGLLDRYCETKARLEVMESHLLTATQMVARVMIWHIQAVEQLNNVICGRQESAIDMPTLVDCAHGMKING